LLLVDVVIRYLHWPRIEVMCFFVSLFLDLPQTNLGFGLFVSSHVTRYLAVLFIKSNLMRIIFLILSVKLI
jgi:hypothetical protein